METGLVVGMITTPAGVAEELAQALVQGELAACVNVVSNVKSVYRWKGEIKSDGEALLIVKSRSEKLEAITQKLREIHPYEIFEFVTLDVTGGNSEYLRWLGESG
jgi:periplasmic divalent cation tolerance protein